MHIQTSFSSTYINQDKLNELKVISSRFDVLRKKEQLTNDEKAEIKTLAIYLGINL
jgi:hypothetical protein